MNMLAIFKSNAIGSFLIAFYARYGLHCKGVRVQVRKKGTMGTGYWCRVRCGVRCVGTGTVCGCDRWVQVRGVGAIGLQDITSQKPTWRKLTEQDTYQNSDRNSDRFRRYFCRYFGIWFGYI